ncbi:MAG TPA: tetratricopeptide repeat protein [Sphingomicrobium sp.]
MKFLRAITAVAALAAIALVPGSALAQRPQPTPEQRLERLERQVQQVQRQVFPRGRPADTAGFSDEPAATQSSVATLDQRLDALERQMADILRQSEENGHALRNLQADLAKVRTDQDQRIAALEQRLNEAAVAAPMAPQPATQPSPPKPAAGKPTAETDTPAPAGGPAAAAATDAGEDAYTEGFHLWEGGQYDQAITSLRAFTSAYPKHRRVSFANNLIGRALLDKGEPRAAAEALLANYRSNPRGERAPDSLYYLGQALIKLGQPGQACKAYQELDAVYGAKVRTDLKQMVQEAETQAQCG